MLAQIALLQKDLLHVNICFYIYERLILSRVIAVNYMQSMFSFSDLALRCILTGAQSADKSSRDERKETNEMEDKKKTDIMGVMQEEEG